MLVVPSGRLFLGRIIRRADTGGHTQQPLITVGGDITIVEHFVLDPCKP